MATVKGELVMGGFVLSFLCLGPSLSDRRGGCLFVEIDIYGGHRPLWSRLRCGSRWLLDCGIDESMVGLWKSVTGLWESMAGLWDSVTGLWSQ